MTPETSIFKFSCPGTVCFLLFFSVIICFQTTKATRTLLIEKNILSPVGQKFCFQVPKFSNTYKINCSP